MDRLDTIKFCLSDRLPYDCIKMILNYIIVIEDEEDRISKKIGYLMYQAMCPLFWKPNELVNLEYVKFYYACLAFATEKNLTYTEFTSWFKHGLKIGIVRGNKSYDYYNYTTPNGDIICLSEASFIYNYYIPELGSFQFSDNNNYIVFEYHSREFNKYKSTIGLVEIKIYQLTQLTYLGLDNNQLTHLPVEIEQIKKQTVLQAKTSKREFYRNQRMENKSRNPKIQKNCSRTSRNRKNHR